MSTLIRDLVLLLHEEHTHIMGIGNMCLKCKAPWPCLAYKVAVEAKEHEDALRAEKAALWKIHLAVVDERDKADALLHAIKLPANYDDLRH